MIGTLTVLSVFLLFCRVGTCIMLMPGFSSPRVPPQIRLFFAIGVTLTMAPLIAPSIETALAGRSIETAAGILVSEVLIGAMIGIFARLFFLALETLGHAATQAVGLSVLPGSAVNDAQPEPALVSLVTISAVVLLFITNQHWEILRGLFASYDAFPVGEVIGPRPALSRVADALMDSFILALRIASPFIVYAIIVNFSIGLTNKLTPQIPVYFIALPFIVFGGLMLLYFIAPEMLHLFTDGFSAWLATR